MAASEPIRVVSIMEAYTVTGPAKNLIRFAARARDNGSGQRPVDLSFVTFGRGVANTSTQFAQAARDSGIRVDIVPERFPFDPRIIPKLEDVLRERRPDIVQTHGVKGHFVFWVSRLHARYRWLAFHHGYTAENFKMRLYNRLNRFSVPAASSVVTVCRPFADALVNLGVKRSRITVVPNSIDPFQPAPPAEIEQLRASLGIQPGTRILLSVGRFSTEKGHADLIPAIARLTTLVPDVPFKHVLVGDGLERQNVEAAAAAAGMADRFVFAGHHRDVRPFYGLADIFVLPSHSEGSPNVLLEAMAASLPAVATAVGGVPDTVTDGHTAIVVPPGDAVRMSDAIATLLGNPDVAARLGENACREAAVMFSPQAYHRQILSVYADLLGEREHTHTS